MQSTRTCGGKGSVTQWKVTRYSVQWEKGDGGEIKITDVYTPRRKLEIPHMYDYAHIFLFTLVTASTYL